MHPADDIRGSKSRILSKKRIVLAVTGSIAAVETVKLAHELIRHGAEIIPVMTPAATKIIHPDSLWFATGNKPVIELTGATEHVSYCGRVKDPIDLLLICPCTANTISKTAHGIDDTSVTTFVTTAIGSNVPIIIVPAMHLSMYDHKIIQKNIKTLKEIGVHFVDPFVDRNKAKMATIEEIVANVFKEVGKKDYEKKKVLIIGGPTAESIDDIRIITNRSSGKTAVWLAKNAFCRGAEITLWYGLGSEEPPDYINTIKFESIKDLVKLIQSKKLGQFDVIFVCAALSDYIPEKQKGKISSRKEKLTIELTTAPKIISILRKKAPKSILIGFKAEEKPKNLKEKSMDILKRNKLNYVIGNTISGFSKDKNEFLIIDKKGKTIRKKGTKECLTNIALDTISKKWT
jgi:phosphopantothenoylcysteine decarboxylase/phosphopantothenate--cysteine ligase